MHIFYYNQLIYFFSSTLIHAYTKPYSQLMYKHLIILKLSDFRLKRYSEFV